MAELTTARNNALPYPIYGMAYVVVFPLLDADGDPISPSSQDSEVSKNGDTFADCTNEAVEIATSSGSCYLILTATEMMADIVAVQIKSTGAKTTVLTLYPRKLAILTSGTCQGSNDTGDIQLASGDSAVDDIYNGCLCVATIDTVVEARIINDYVGSTKVAEVSPAWVTAQPDNNDTYTIYLPEGRSVNLANVTHIAGTAQTARDLGASVLLSSGTGTGQLDFTSGVVKANVTAIANGIIVAATFAANALDAVWSTATRLLTAGTNIVLAKGTGVTGFNDLDAAGVRSAVGLASANLDTQLDALPTNAELGTALGTADDAVLTAIADLPTNAELATALGTADDAVLAAVALVKAKTDSLTFTVAGQVDANVQRINDVTIVGDGSGTPFNV